VNEPLPTVCLSNKAAIDRTRFTALVNALMVPGQAKKPCFSVAYFNLIFIVTAI
jgi:hypothetical protein